MSLLKELCSPTLRQQLQELENQLNRLIDDASLIVEAYPQMSQDIVTDQLMAQLDDAIRQMQAAKRGLGLANRLSGESKRRHQSRIMGNMNRIRAIVKSVQKQIKNNNEEM